MRTNLTYIKNELFYNVIHQQYKHIVGATVNHKSFLMAFFPMEFLSSEENQSIIATQSNNSSRLSNIFSRASDSKRLEARFRKRFVSAFDQSFLDEMVHNAEYYLKKHNQNALYRLVETILKEDEELKENKVFYKIFKESEQYEPAIIVALLIIWAFHIGDFTKLEQVIETYPKSVTKGISPELNELNQLIYEKKLSHKQVYDYLNITTTFSASCTLGAIAMEAYIQNNNDVNPLIYNELANMHFYGYNYIKQDKKKALELFQKAGEEKFGSPLWSIGTMTNNERHKVRYNRVPVVISYFNSALEANNPMPLNNLGIMCHRAFIYYLMEHLKFPFATDCFAKEARKDALEMYDYFKDDDFFKNLMEQLPSTFDSGFESQAHLIKAIESCEDAIIDHYLRPAFESKYFFAKGSELMIYENQLKRMTHFYLTFNRDFDETAHFKTLSRKISEACQSFSSYPCSESYYKYGLLLESKGDDYIQPAYEYYYNAVFEVPNNAYFYHAIWRLLLLHFEGPVPYLKEFDTFYLVKKILLKYPGQSIGSETILLDIIKIYDEYLKEFHPLYLTSQEKRIFKTHLNIEKRAHLELSKEYDYWINYF